MDLFLWLIIFYFIIGLLVYLATIKSVKSKVTLIKTGAGNQENSKDTKFVVLWIAGITIWGVAGIFLIVSWFL